MAATIPSLWPEDIKVDVLPPVVILKYQAAKLRELTKGILQAEVTTTTGWDDFVVHRLELLAPQLENRRYGVLTVTHRSDFYPVVLEADCYRPRHQFAAGPLVGAAGSAVTTTAPWPPKNDWRPVAANQDEFLKRVGEVLRSMEVRSVIDSLIALSNQKSLAGDAGDEASGETQNGSPA
jgi:hypothetical protein